MPGITATENKLFEFRALYGAHSVFKRESTFFPFLVNTKNWEEMEGGLLQCTMYFEHSTAVHIARGIESSHSAVYSRVMLGKRTSTLHSSEKSISELHPPVLQTKSTEHTTILVCYYFLLSLCKERAQAKSRHSPASFTFSWMGWDELCSTPFLEHGFPRVALRSKVKKRTAVLGYLPLPRNFTFRKISWNYMNKERQQ